MLQPSGGSLHGGSSFRVEKTHFAACKEGPENCQNISEIATPSVSPPENRELKMRTNFLSTNFWNTPRGPGYPGKIPGTSQIPLFETQGRQTFEGEHEVFGHHPFVWKTPTPPGGLRTQKLNLCAFFLA